MFGVFLEAITFGFTNGGETRYISAAPLSLLGRFFDGLLLLMALWGSKGKFILLITKNILYRLPFICIQA